MERKNDGFFWIPLDAYLENYARTTLAAEADPLRYRHSRISSDFSGTSHKFFRIELHNSIDFLYEVMGIMLAQTGEGFKSYRKRNSDNRFYPSSFSICMFAEDGRFIGFESGGQFDFNFSLLLKDGNLQPGNYFFGIFPRWNKEAKFCPEYKKLNIAVYSTQRF